MQSGRKRDKNGHKTERGTKITPGQNWFSVLCFLSGGGWKNTNIGAGEAKTHAICFGGPGELKVDNNQSVCSRHGLEDPPCFFSDTSGVHFVFPQKFRWPSCSTLLPDIVSSSRAPPKDNEIARRQDTVSREIMPWSLRRDSSFGLMRNNVAHD